MTTPNPTKRLRTPGRVLANDEQIITIKMSVDDWIKTPDHPRQRDVIHHAGASHWREAKLAEGALKAHLCHVTGALLDGQLYKVDGHTRAYLWEKGVLKRPEEVVVTVYRVRDRQELLELYKAIDVFSAADTPRDKVAGALREQGFNPRSQVVARGLLAEALHIALRGIPRSKRSKTLREFDIYKAVAAFIPEIVMLDQVDPNVHVFRSGITAAALIMLCLDRTSVGFFQRLSERRGEKHEGKMDPVEAVLSLILEFRMQKYRRPPMAQVELCGRCIRAVLGWMEGKDSEAYWRCYRPSSVDVLEYVEKVRALKGIGDDPSL